MSWTDDRVETLKKLWMEGLSASQIANELGMGVTRNAVIGKVHRLKLSGRAKPATSSSRPRAAARSATRSASSNSTPRRRSSSGGGATRGNTALKVDAVADQELNVALNAEKELFIPVEERIGLLALTEKTCKWPIGDPLAEDFHFCGRDSEEDAPYCEFHSKRAYHQLDRRKK